MDENIAFGSKETSSSFSFEAQKALAQEEALEIELCDLRSTEARCNHEAKNGGVAMGQDALRIAVLLVALSKRADGCLNKLPALLMREHVEGALAIFAIEANASGRVRATQYVLAEKKQEEDA